MRVIKKIKPMFTTVITTMNILEEKDMCFSGTSIIDSSKMRRSVDEFQTVLAVGPHVNGVQVAEDLFCFGRRTDSGFYVLAGLCVNRNLVTCTACFV